MKKLLKLLFVLSSSTTLPLAVVACGQQSLDSILNIIKDGDTKYGIDQVLPDKKIEEYQKNYSLSNNDATLLAKAIAEKILTKSGNKTEIKWADDNVTANETVYSFKIIEEKQEEETNNEDGYTWAAMADTGTFNFKINYWVGTIDEQKQFHAVQQISMSFDIKCYRTESDKIVEAWIAKFNEQIAKEQPLNIDLAEESELPKEGAGWSDLDSKVQSKTYATLNSIIGTTNVSWHIQSDSVVAKDQLEIFLSVNKKNTVKETKPFTVKFQQV